MAGAQVAQQLVLLDGSEGMRMLCRVPNALAAAQVEQDRRSMHGAGALALRAWI